MKVAVMKAETVVSKMIHWANAAERLLNDLNSPDDFSFRRGIFFSSAGKGWK